MNTALALITLSKMAGFESFVEEVMAATGQFLEAEKDPEIANTKVNNFSRILASTKYPQFEGVEIDCGEAYFYKKAGFLEDYTNEQVDLMLVLDNDPKKSLPYIIKFALETVLDKMISKPEMSEELLTEKVKQLKAQHWQILPCIAKRGELVSKIVNELEDMIMIFSLAHSVFDENFDNEKTLLDAKKRLNDGDDVQKIIEELFNQPMENLKKEVMH